MGNFGKPLKTLVHARKSILGMITYYTADSTLATPSELQFSGPGFISENRTSFTINIFHLFTYHQSL